MSGVRLYVDADASEMAVIVGLLAAAESIYVRIWRLAVWQRRTRISWRTRRNKKRAIYTFNASDFARLHRDCLQAGRSHAGIIVISEQRYSIGEKYRRLAAFIHSMTAESLRDRIVYL